MKEYRKDQSIQRILPVLNLSVIVFGKQFKKIKKNWIVYGD